MRLAPILIGLFMTTSNAMAEENLPKPWIAPYVEKAPTTLHRAMPPRVEVGKTAIILETTRLSDLYRDDFIGAISHTGDAAESMSWSCGEANTSSGTVRICVESDEIDGGDIIGALTIERIPSPGYALPLKPISFAGRAKFGATLDALIHIFGAPSYREDGKDGSVLVDWRYSQPFPSKPGDSFETHGDLIIRFDNNMMTKLSFRRTTSD